MLWWTQAHFALDQSAKAKFTYYVMLGGMTFLAPFITFIIFRPNPKFIRQAWKVGMLTLAISFIVENAGVLFGFWGFNQPSLFPAPVTISMGFGWSAISLLWLSDWVLRMENSVLKQSLPFVFLILYAVMGTVSDWTNPDWLPSKTFNPSFTFLLWVFVVGAPFIYSFQLCKRTLQSASPKRGV